MVLATTCVCWEGGSLHFLVYKETEWVFCTTFSESLGSTAFQCWYHPLYSWTPAIVTGANRTLVVMPGLDEFSTNLFQIPWVYCLSVLVSSLVLLDTCHCNSCQSDLCLLCLGWMGSVPCALITLSCSQRPICFDWPKFALQNCQLYWPKPLHHLVLVCLPMCVMASHKSMHPVYMFKMSITSSAIVSAHQYINAKWSSDKVAANLIATLRNNYSNFSNWDGSVSNCISFIWTPSKPRLSSSLYLHYTVVWEIFAVKNFHC